MRTQLTLICAMAVWAVGCGGGGKKAPATGGTSKEMKMQTAEPSATTKEVLGQIAGYQSWPKFTENATPKQSKGHMNMFVLAFHNDVVTGALEAKTLPLPDGSIIVKQNMAKATDSAPMAITVMAKRGGKWHWSETTPDGKVVVMEGKALEGEDVGMCVNCHQQSEDNDFVVTHPIK